jgi:hypothetical protein
MCPAARKRNDPYARQRLCELGYDRREDRWALVAEREEGWLREPSNPIEVEAKLLCIVRLIEKGWCILDEYVPGLGRQLSPGAGPKRHGLNELFGGTAIVTGGDPLDHGSDPWTHFRKQRGYGRVGGDQREQWRLVSDEASEEVGTLTSQSKGVLPPSIVVTPPETSSHQQYAPRECSVQTRTGSFLVLRKQFAQRRLPSVLPSSTVVKLPDALLEQGN